METLLKYMQIYQTVNSKVGSKITSYKEPQTMRNLSSMIRINSHDYPEIRLNSSSIFFSGSENSPEKMNVISTKFGLQVNYDMVMKDAFEACKQNFLCSQ